MEKRIRVLMCGSDIRTVKGGMVTVEKNYLEYPGWKKAEITFIPTHTEGNPLKKCLCFAFQYQRLQHRHSLRGKIQLQHLRNTLFVGARWVLHQLLKSSRGTEIPRHGC